MRLSYYFFYAVSLVWSINCTGQTFVIDSLKTVVTRSTTTEEKLAAIFALCEQRHSLNPDTLYLYAAQASALSLQLHNQKDMAMAQYSMANYLLKKGYIDSALNICNQNILRLKNNQSSREVLNDFMGCKAGILIKKNEYKEAMAQFYFILNEAENAKDTARQLTGKNGIGWVYMEMDQNNSALNWLFRALNTSANPKYLPYLVYIYSNISANYSSLHNNDSAEYFINKAISLGRRFQNLTALANSLNIQADIFIETKRFSLAEKSLTEALGIRKLVADPFYTVSDMMQLAKFYATTGQPGKGIAVSNEGISLAHKYNLTSKLLILYAALAENYNAAGDKLHYARTLEQIISLKDSLYGKNSAEALADIQAKYDLQKKENIIIQQKLDIVKKDYILYGSLSLLVFVVLIVALLFRNYSRRQKMQLELRRQEEKNTSFIAIRKAEEIERKRIAADLHDNMGAYATAIIANVDDVVQQRTHQNANTLNNLKNNASEIMSNLRDTIWALNKERIPITGISDRFKNYINKISPVYPEVKIEIVERIEVDKTLSPVQALNIFRILQESCTNALKHSHCTQIQVSIQCNNVINITIMDNGSGINEKNFQRGNGIRNMQTRATESGFSIEISGDKEGTTIILSS